VLDGGSADPGIDAGGIPDDEVIIVLCCSLDGAIYQVASSRLL